MKKTIALVTLVCSLALCSCTDKTNIGIINVNGYNLSLEEMTTDDIIVKGKIESIDFESIEDDREDGKVVY